MDINIEDIKVVEIRDIPNSIDEQLKNTLVGYHGNAQVDDLFQLESFLECGQFSELFVGQDDYTLREKVQELQIELCQTVYNQ